jgi:hypothetical protein
MLVHRPVNLIYTRTERKLEVHGMTAKLKGKVGRKCDTGLIISSIIPLQALLHTLRSTISHLLKNP